MRHLLQNITVTNNVLQKLCFLLQLQDVTVNTNTVEYCDLTASYLSTAASKRPCFYLQKVTVEVKVTSVKYTVGIIKM